MSSKNGNPTFEVQKYGQSLWYDNIQRSLIKSGELQRLIDDYGVLGITSNPSIFDKAITGSADYDDDIVRLVEQGADTNTIYESLAIVDIQAAADILEPIYEQTDGVDGYISLEVSPHLAHDYDGTVNEARRLFRTVGRKNLMVKVPATPAGIPAIQTLIADGININVTLIFSLEGYEAVARAYLAGLMERAAKGQSLDIASVASFFISRVDTAVDKLLDEKIAATPEWDKDLKARLQALKGKAAIANGKLAYEIFERIFNEPEFRELAATGARPQRVLLASTSTKNPAYRDTYYVENLIGKDTVDTMPPATLKAFRDHGIVAPTLHEGWEEAHQTMRELAGVGVSMDEVWQKLQDDGVKLFADAFDALFAGIESKRMAVHARGEAVNVESALGYVDELTKMKAANRVWQRDASLWTNAPEHIKVVSNRLGWLSIVDAMLGKVNELNAFAEAVKAHGMTDVVVLGMGGSSLATEVLRQIGSAPPSAPLLHERGDGRGLRIHTLDTTDPTMILNLANHLDLKKTLFIVASKSGNTLEVNAFYKYFRAKVDEFAGDDAGRHFVAITDDGTSLENLATEEGFGRVFINPGDIGGRYSALSYFGLVPAVLHGIDIATLLKRAQQMAAWCKSDSAANPGLYLGALLGGMALDGRDKVTFILSPQFSTFGYWLEQLIAESMGKHERGIVPVEGEIANGSGPVSLKSGISGLSPDRLYVCIKLSDDSTNDRLVASLKRARLPVITLPLSDAYDLGAEFFRWEFATAIAGVVIGVDPFDEPNVTESKVNTRRLLGEFEANGEFSNEFTSRSANGQINKFLRGAKVGDYVAIQAYLPHTEEVAGLLARLRATVREKTGAPVTVGYGPRYLHGTGQLHKGGANNVVALQLTYDPEEEVLIAGEPFSFATLMRAQALGDYESLQARQRRVIRLHLGYDIKGGFKKIMKVLNGSARRAKARAANKPARQDAAAKTQRMESAAAKSITRKAKRTPTAKKANASTTRRQDAATSRSTSRPQARSGTRSKKK